MSAGAAIALRAALRNVLLTNASLVQRLAGPRVYDEAPAGAEMPYICFADVRTRDWSTNTDSGAEHTLAIDVWTRHHGVQEALEISEMMALALAAGTPAPIGHHLVSLQQRNIETRREHGGRHARARLTFRAVTEKA